MNARIAAEDYRIFKNSEATSIDEIPPLANFSPDSISSGDVLSLCIDRVPMPSDLTPWEQILDMKADTDLSDRARKLRLWAREVSSNRLSILHANEYIDNLIADYERYMKLHTKKFNRGMIETVLIGSAELIEDILKFRFGDIAKKVLDVRGKENELLIAEMEAPGREVSLIARLQDRIA